MFWFLKSVNERENFLRVIVIEDECNEKTHQSQELKEIFTEMLERRPFIFPAECQRTELPSSRLRVCWVLLLFARFKICVIGIVRPSVVFDFTIRSSFQICPLIIVQDTSFLIYRKELNELLNFSYFIFNNFPETTVKKVKMRK